MSAPDTVALEMPLEVGVRVDTLAREMGCSPVEAIDKAVRALGLVRWTVFNFGGGFPSRRLPPEALEAE